MWHAILRWLDVDWVSPRCIIGCFEIFLGLDMSRKNILYVVDVNLANYYVDYLELPK
jgi:hypothetical protein